MSLELEVAREINALKELDLDKLSQSFCKLPIPTKFVSRSEIPKDYHLFSEPEFLEALLGVFERFPAEEDFGLWSTVANSIELFKDSMIQAALYESMKRQPMWKTAELANQYCTTEQCKALIQHCQKTRSHGPNPNIDFGHIIHILEGRLEG